MDILAKKKDVVWIYLIPFYHLLTDASQSSVGEYKAQERWGTAGFVEIVKAAKENNSL